METTTDANPLPPSDPRPDPTPPLGTPPPPVRLLRRADDSALGGVATGLANYFGLTPVLIQVAFVVLTAFSGFGVMAYLACWLLLPKVSDPETRPVTITSDTGRAIIGVLFAIGAASSTLTLGPNTFEITLLPLALIAGGFYLLNQRETGAPHSTQPHSTQPDSTQPHSSQPHSSQPHSSQPHWTELATAPSPAIPTAPPGPPVTSVTLAAAAVAVGSLMTINQFGASIPAGAILGTALAVIGGGLVYGAFRGRARGLVPVGILLTMGLAVAPAIDALADGGTGTREYSPLTQADVLDIYDLGAGPLDLDLRSVDFTTDQSIVVNVGAGYAEILLPDDVNVDVDARVAAGYVDLFGRENAGVFAEGTASRSAGELDRPTITLDVEITFGYVEVRRG